jgi:hypothetical protein
MTGFMALTASKKAVVFGGDVAIVLATAIRCRAMASAIRKPIGNFCFQITKSASSGGANSRIAGVELIRFDMEYMERHAVYG